MENDHNCLRKEAYLTFERAELVAMKRKGASGIELRVYSCGTHFHLTSQVSKEYEEKDL